MGIISFADAGLSSAVTREFAKTHTNAVKYIILNKIEKVYLSICLVIGIVIFSCSSLIASKWLNIDIRDSIPIISCIKLIGIGVSLQLLSTLYFGGLMGLEKQFSSNLIQLLWGIIKNFGIILLINFFSIDIAFFFIWQIICNLIYIVCLRINLMSYLDVKVNRYDIKNYKLDKELLKYIGGMSLITIMSSINIQADKLVTSGLFTLKEFGYYSLASTVSQIPLLVSIPIALTVFPIVIRKLFEGGKKELLDLYGKYCFLISLIVSTIGMCIILFTNDILLIWTGKFNINDNMLAQTIKCIRFLTIGGVFLSLQLMPYYFLLAKGLTRYNLIQGICQIVFLIPSLYFFITKFGLIGVCFPWLIINVGAFIYLNIVVKNHIDSPNYIRTVIFSVIVPLMSCLIIGSISYYILPNYIDFFIVRCVLVVMVCLSFNIAFFNFSKGQKLFNIVELFS
jgi:O-antigen/teichoic acid export membrane protein